MTKKRWILALLLSSFIGNATAAGRLVVERAWIRAAPPGAVMLAGYATLRNTGDGPLVVVGADSAEFDAVSLHRSLEENGVEHMRPLDRVELAAGAAIEFAPGGNHFMLMRPARALTAGMTARIRIRTESGDVSAEFEVRDDAP